MSVFKKIAAVLFYIVFAVAVVALCFTVETAMSWMLGKTELRGIEIEAVTYFMRLSGILIGIAVLIRWVTKWPWTVSWFSLGLGATGFAFAAMGHYMNQLYWHEPMFLPWKAVMFVFFALSNICLLMWVFNPRFQKPKTAAQAVPKK
ncbi:MAG TPA: hypothetical protein VF803_03455 [Candidatus Paceibacterota bacterium]